MTHFYYGYCVEAGCGERFVRKSHCHRFCEKHSRILKDISKQIAPTKCKLCERVFTGKVKNALYCTEACSRAASNLAKQKKRAKEKKKKKIDYAACGCGTLFKKQTANQIRCGECSRKKRDGSSTNPLRASSKHELPCFMCKHSKPNRDATYGIECSIGFWLRCKPLLPGAKPLEVRDEALDITA
jgi:hypothetical protein